MLKTIRERLIDELRYFSEELKKAKREYAKYEKEYKSGQELIKATNYQKTTSSALFGGILPSSTILLVGGGFIFAFWEIIGKFLLAGEIFLAIYFGKNFIKNIKNYKAANKRLETAQGNISDSIFEGVDDLGIFEFDLDIRVQYNIDNYAKKIKMYEESIKSLWSILNSNNLANMLDISYQNTLDISNILEEEWTEYLEEISKIPISEVHFEPGEMDEECYKEATRLFHVEPKKLENKPQHPLSIN